MSRDSSLLCTRWSFGRSHKRRFEDVFLKIGDGAESNQNRGGVKWIRGDPREPDLLFENNPMHSRQVIDFIEGQMRAPENRAQPGFTASWRRAGAGLR